MSWKYDDVEIWDLLDSMFPGMEQELGTASETIENKIYWALKVVAEVRTKAEESALLPNNPKTDEEVAEDDRNIQQLEVHLATLLSIRNAILVSRKAPGVPVSAMCAMQDQQLLPVGALGRDHTNARHCE